MTKSDPSLESFTIGNLSAVLVRPTISANVGQAIRALANNGADELILLAPECDPFNLEAQSTAAGAKDFFDRIRIVSSWSEYFDKYPSSFRVALTRRKGKRRRALDLSRTLTELAKQAPEELAGQSLHLFFGPEAHGLSADDMAWCHRLAFLPIQGDFGSMNLAQAVMLGLFLARQVFQRQRATKVAPISPKTKNKFGIDPHMPDESIRRWLTAMGFDIRKRRMSAYLTLKRLILQNWPSPRELQVLEAILQQNIRKLELAKNKKMAAKEARD